MSVAGTLALSIRANTEKVKQDLKPALDAIKEWGVAAEKAGLSTSEVNREMAKMRAEASRGPKAAAEATNTLQQNLQKAKMGAAALSGAVSAMSSEVGGAVGHVTRLGTSLVSSFLAGGPVALGITAIAAAFSAMGGSAREAAEEVKRAEEAVRRLREEGDKNIESIRGEVAAKRDAIDVGRGLISQSEADERAARRRWQKRVADTEKGIAEEKAAILRWSQERAELEARRLSQGVGGIIAGKSGEEEKRDAWIARAKARLEMLAKEMDEARKLEMTERELDNQRKTAAEAEEKSKKKVEVSNKETKKDIEDILKGAKAWNAIGDEIAKDAERINAALSGELAANISRAYGMEAQMTEQAVRAAEAAKEMAESTKSAADDSQMIAAAAEVRAEAEAKVTEQVREQSRLVAKRLDITKRFSNVGGSMFGFGAGQVGTGIGDIGGDANRARRAAGDIPGKGGGLAAQIASGKGLQLPDVSAQIKALEAEIAKVPPLFERLSGAVTGFGSATKAAVVEMGKSTERAVGNIRSQTDALRAEVRSLSKAIERAGNGTGVGD